MDTSSNSTDPKASPLSVVKAVMYEPSIHAVVAQQYSNASNASQSEVANIVTRRDQKMLDNTVKEFLFRQRAHGWNYPECDPDNGYSEYYTQALRRYDISKLPTQDFETIAASMRRVLKAKGMQEAKVLVHRESKETVDKISIYVPINYKEMLFSKPDLKDQFPLLSR